MISGPRPDAEGEPHEPPSPRTPAAGAGPARARRCRRPALASEPLPPGPEGELLQRRAAAHRARWSTPTSPRSRRLFGDELRFIHANGSVETKYVLLAALESGRLDYVSAREPRPVVRVYGEAGVVRGHRACCEVRAAGGPRPEARATSSPRCTRSATAPGASSPTSRRAPPRVDVAELSSRSARESRLPIDAVLLDLDDTLLDERPGRARPATRSSPRSARRCPRSPPSPLAAELDRQSRWFWSRCRSPCERTARSPGGAARHRARAARGASACADDALAAEARPALPAPCATRCSPGCRAPRGPRRAPRRGAAPRAADERRRRGAAREARALRPRAPTSTTCRSRAPRASASPRRAPSSHALAALGAAPERAVMVGNDFEFDVLGALGGRARGALDRRRGRRPAAPRGAAPVRRACASIDEVPRAPRRPCGRRRLQVREFRDRVAVVTGAASGIGRALALALARRGAAARPRRPEPERARRGRGARSRGLGRKASRARRRRRRPRRAWRRFPTRCCASTVASRCS